MVQNNIEEKFMPGKYKKIAYSFVMADLLHYGHIKLLKTARDNADYHVCGLISDEACHTWQGINICNFEERKLVLESIDCVDEVLLQETMDPTDNLKRLRKRFPGAELIVVHGDDWKTLPAREYIESIGGKIIQPEYYAQLSRNALVKKFKETTPDHPLSHELFPLHFRVGNIEQFSTQKGRHLVSTKADTLKNFQSVLTLSKIEKLFICTVGDFKHYESKVANQISERFSGETVIVRSSSVNEDGYSYSNAGAFCSIAGIDPTDKKAVKEAVGRVIASYEKAGKVSSSDQVLIQVQTEDILSSGVVFTRNLQNNTPYYLINYDEGTEKTDTVTSGEAGMCTWLLRDLELDKYPGKWRPLIAAIREVEEHLPGMVLDIEFAIKKDGPIIIFQIRPLAANVRYSQDTDDPAFMSRHRNNLNRYEESIEGYLFGTPFLSDMAFWNPSEIIGDDPRNLDYSLYREIITRRAWNDGLTAIGYSAVKKELMQRYGNKPYINLDHSFMSLTPASIPMALRKKLVSFYRERLGEDPTAHDKIEFEIVMSSYDFETDEKLQKMGRLGFSSGEIDTVSGALKDITIDIIRNYPKRIKSLRRELVELRVEREQIKRSSRSFKDYGDYLKASLKLLTSISKYGTPQFTTVARMAFIAGSITKSLVNMEFFTPTEMDSFYESISTVTSAFDGDFRKYVSGRLSRNAFINKYGHLRAGTYDIKTPCYAHLEFKSGRSAHSKLDGAKPRRRKGLDKRKLKRAMEGTVFAAIRASELEFFMRSTVIEREFFKFEFTKSLSLALEFLASAGGHLGFGRDDLSHLDLVAIKSSLHYDNAYELGNYWRILIDGSSKVFNENSKLILPDVIFGGADFFVIDSVEQRPNFITQRRVRGRVVDLDNDDGSDLTGAIVLLKKADPGYDWIFTRDIRGLITRYGGPASHMAIRCAELDVPAAIGSGEMIYDMVKRNSEIVLDCGGKKIRRVVNYT